MGSHPTVNGVFVKPKILSRVMVRFEDGLTTQAQTLVVSTDA